MKTNSSRSAVSYLGVQNFFRSIRFVKFWYVKLYESLQWSQCSVIKIIFLGFSSLITTAASHEMALTSLLKLAVLTSFLYLPWLKNIAVVECAVVDVTWLVSSQMYYDVSVTSSIGALTLALNKATVNSSDTYRFVFCSNVQHAGQSVCELIWNSCRLAFRGLFSALTVIAVMMLCS